MRIVWECAGVPLIEEPRLLTGEGAAGFAQKMMPRATDNRAVKRPCSIVVTVLLGMFGVTKF